MEEGGGLTEGHSTAECPSVSIVIPCRNEARYIAPCLASILASEYPRDRLEVIIADGMSDDGTREIIAGYAAEHGRVTMVDNPPRITPAGLNAAIRAARGEIIVRMDAHAIYPPEYVPKLVAALLETEADNVGTTVVTLPGDETATARAIAIGLSHPLGVGNSHFRVGTATRRWVDHVPFGCWRRSLFDRIGLFDEELPRDQDVEFNLRTLTQGGRILLLPDVASQYHARRTLSQVSRMLYQYGYFKPLVARKIGRIVTLRQVVPSIFLVTLLGAGLLSPWWSAGRVVFAAVAGVYVALVVSCAVLASVGRGWRCRTALIAAFPLMHLGYGFGYLRGLLDHFLLHRRVVRAPTSIAITR
ncbi:MAG: glycosyltransferase family 2 protein [Gemmatimonadales bacterium]